MKVGILTCMWRRAEVFRIFAAGIERLRQNFDFLMPLAVGSESDKSMSLCRDAGIYYLEWPNRPLGAKFNTGMLAMKRYSPDYVIILGSDDIISNGVIDAYLPFMNINEPCIGLLDLYFYALRTGEFKFWPGYIVKRVGESAGLGRALSAETLERLSWMPWDSKLEKGLDWSMTQKLNKLRIKPVGLHCNDSIFAMDIKSETNICAMQLYGGLKPANTKLFERYLSEQEIKLLRHGTDKPVV